jgi:cobalt transporter subunit CbtB
MDLVGLSPAAEGGRDRRADECLERVATMAPAFATCVLGLLILFCVGFMHVPVIHNGAHDTRHADGFPCH